ncbi:MAG: peptidyl-prolyl cis-trans isomerase [Acidobacteriota bacterium]
MTEQRPTHVPLAVGKLVRGLSFLGALFCLSCATEGSDEAEVVLATYRDGSVTLEELDRQLRRTGLSPESPEVATDTAALEESVRRAAIDEIALSVARSDGTADSPEFAARRRDLLRRSAAERALLDEPGITSITRAELAAYFEQRRDDLEQPERRRVQHIFKRTGPGRPKATVREELEALRSRALGGESFGLLAAESSDSETRHQEGSLGLVVPGQFSPDFDSVVFALEEGEPSEPVFTADGGHVFWVADVLPERRVELAEVAVDLQRELLLQRRDEALARLAEAALEAQPETYLPEEFFADQLRLTRAPQVLFRVGSFEYRLADFQRAGAEMDAAESRSGTPAELLRRIYHEEVLMQYGPAADEDGSPEEDAALVEVFLSRELRRAVEVDLEALRAHYQRNAARFASPLRVSYSRLSVPKNPGGAQRMAALEESLAELDEGRESLETLAERLRGRVERVERRTVAALRATDPAALRFVLSLPPGRHAPPYSNDERIFLLRLDERIDAETLPFEAARESIVADIVATRLPELYNEYGARLLSENGFRLDRRQLQRGARLLARLP